MYYLLHLSPKGALTAKPYSFKIRAWELSSLETIDTGDHFNSSIYLQYKNSKIVRILPKKVKNSISLISDISRFGFDSLSYNRSNSTPKSSIEYKKSFGNSTGKNLLLASNSLSLGSLILLKFFEKRLKNTFIRREIFSLNSFIVFWNSFNLYQKLDTVSKLCFISSSSLSVESILLNVKIRLKYNKKHFNIFYCGYYVNSSYSLKFLSLKIKPFFFLLKSKSFVGLYFFKLFKFITFIIGESLIRRVKDLINVFNTFSLRIKTCLFYFLAKQKNHLVTQLIPLKTINKRILNRVNKIVLTQLDDTLQTIKIVKAGTFNKELISFSSFNTYLSKNSQSVFSVSSTLESSGIFFDLEQTIKKSNKFPGILSQNLDTSLASCFGFFTHIRLILNTYKIFFRRSLNYTLSAIISETLKSIQLSGEFSSVFKTTNSAFNYFSSVAYPDKSIFEDRFRYNLSTKNSLTMLNCSIDSRKECLNF